MEKGLVPTKEEIAKTSWPNTTLVVKQVTDKNKKKYYIRIIPGDPMIFVTDDQYKVVALFPTGSRSSIFTNDGVLDPALLKKD